MAKRGLTEKEKASVLDALLSSGILTKEALTKGIMGKAPVKAEVKVLGEFKDKKGNTIVIAPWTDKEGVEYISQTKVLPDGTRTKGFAIPKAEFKSYVAKLNSIVDKMA